MSRLQPKKINQGEERRETKSFRVATRHPYVVFSVRARSARTSLHPSLTHVSLALSYRIHSLNVLRNTLTRTPRSNTSGTMDRDRSEQCMDQKNHRSTTRLHAPRTVPTCWLYYIQNPSSEKSLGTSTAGSTEQQISTESSSKYT